MVGRGDDRTSEAGRRGEWLFAEDVAARLGGGAGGDGQHVVRRGDDDRVEMGQIEQGSEIGTTGQVCAADGVHSQRVGVTACDEASAGHSAQRASKVTSLLAGADQAEAEHVGRAARSRVWHGAHVYTCSHATSSSALTLLRGLCIHVCTAAQVGARQPVCPGEPPPVPATQRHLVLRVDDVQPFLQPGQDVYWSQQVLGRENTGLHDCFLNCGRVAAQRALGGGNHPDNDEVYYVVSGRSWLDLGGDPSTGQGCTSYQVEPGSVAFIPAGTFHRLRNEADEDLVILTIWPQAAAPGANGVHDARLAEWGTGFRLRSGRRLVEAEDGAYVAAADSAPAR